MKGHYMSVFYSKDSACTSELEQIVADLQELAAECTCDVGRYADCGPDGIVADTWNPRQRKQPSRPPPAMTAQEVAELYHADRSVLTTDQQLWQDGMRSMVEHIKDGKTPKPREDMTPVDAMCEIAAKVPTEAK